MVYDGGVIQKGGGDVLCVFDGSLSPLMGVYTMLGLHLMERKMRTFFYNIENVSFLLSSVNFYNSSSSSSSSTDRGASSNSSSRQHYVFDWVWSQSCSATADIFFAGHRINRWLYFFYHGSKQVSLLTVHFNMTSNFCDSFMTTYLQDKLTTTPYQLQSRILASVHYDLLLCNGNATPKTFYIWRSNTNRTTLNVDHQVNMTITYANINRFCENVTNVNLSDLQVNFVSSDVTVDCILVIVFTFEY